MAARSTVRGKSATLTCCFFSLLATWGLSFGAFVSTIGLAWYTWSGEEREECWQYRLHLAIRNKPIYPLPVSTKRRIVPSLLQEFVPARMEGLVALVHCACNDWSKAAVFKVSKGNGGHWITFSGCHDTQLTLWEHIILRLICSLSPIINCTKELTVLAIMNSTSKARAYHSLTPANNMILKKKWDQTRFDLHRSKVKLSSILVYIPVNYSFIRLPLRCTQNCRWPYKFMQWHSGTPKASSTEGCIICNSRCIASMKRSFVQLLILLHTLHVAGEGCQVNCGYQASKDLHAPSPETEEDPDGGGETSNHWPRQSDIVGEDGPHHEN